MKFCDAYLEWHSDLNVSVSGDLLIAQDFLLVRQRIIRRLLTNLGDVLFQPNFGVGIGRYIDEPLSEDLYTKLTRRILDQVYQEDLVSRNPEPDITFTPMVDGLLVSITVWLLDGHETTLRIGLPT